MVSVFGDHRFGDSRSRRDHRQTGPPRHARRRRQHQDQRLRQRRPGTHEAVRRALRQPRTAFVRSLPSWRRARGSRQTGLASKRPLVALVERGGKTKMFHVENATAEAVREILVQHASRKSDLHTDESRLYTETGKEFAAHRTVKHSAGEYARVELVGHNEDESEFYFRSVHSNNVENVFSVFKRGMTGVYQHCGEAHLHRYLTEFEFRRNRRTALGYTDGMRTNDALKGIEGKRLTYRRIGEAAHD